MYLFGYCVPQSGAAIDENESNKVTGEQTVFFKRSNCIRVVKIMS